MCVTCGCGDPPNSHDDPRNITFDQLADAADAAGITPEQAAANIVLTLANLDAGDIATDEAAVKSDVAAMRVLKAQEERRYTLGLGYAAWVAPGRGADNFNDFISEDALERCAWEWMAKRREIGLFHQDRPELDGHGTVVESYIYRGPDWEVASPVDGTNVVIKAGDWLVGVVWDEYGWDLVKSRKVNGWSPEGGARRRVPTADRLAQLRS